MFHRNSSNHPFFHRCLVVSLTLLSFAATAPAFPQEPDPADLALDYMTRHGDRIALVHYAVSPEGTADRELPGIFHRQDLPLPLASTVKILLLATYTREVAAGRMDPSEAVPVGDWQTHYHLFFEEHPRSLAELGIATDPLGFALDPSATVSLDTIARKMIRNSDNAATDYLLARLGKEAFEATVEEAGLNGQESLFSLVGLFMTLANHEQGVVTEERLQALLAMDRQTFVAEAERLSRLHRDPAWRQEEILWILGADLTVEPSAVAALADTHFPKGIARDYAQVMGQVLTGNFLSPEVSQLMREHLESPLEGTGLEDLFFLIGHKGGDIDGTLTMARYTVPKVGEMAGRPLVSVLFLNGLPPLEDLSEIAGPAEIFILRLWLDGTFADRVRETLCTPDATTLCLHDGRFRAELEWRGRGGQEGSGYAVPSSAGDSGLFWMFAPDNWEILVKVLDGCGVNGHHWLFCAGATNLGYSLTVTDTASGQRRECFHSPGPAAPAIIDTTAFGDCTDGALGGSNHDPVQ